MRAIETKGLRYAYPDGIRALEDIDLAVEEGEKIAIVGNNGAGKSTLLELLAGFRFPFEGEVRIRDVPLTREDAPRLRRRLGLLFQDPDDQIFMPRVWDDVAFGPRNLGWPPERVAEAVERNLEDLGIRDLRDRPPHRLSHGQKKRVAIAGILAMDPEILLLDEPVAGLDGPTRADVLSRLAEMDRTILLATHDLEEVLGFVDRIFVLQMRKLADSSPTEILGREDLLEEAGLQIPALAHLIGALRAYGTPREDLPVSVEEALRKLLALRGLPLTLSPGSSATRSD